jgi:hypothetical protein
MILSYLHRCSIITEALQSDGWRLKRRVREPDVVVKAGSERNYLAGFQDKRREPHVKEHG